MQCALRLDNNPRIWSTLFELAFQEPNKRGFGQRILENPSSPPKRDSSDVGENTTF